ncbi:MAG: DNA-binding response regulator [Blastococcus sp.]|jgi:DNA-binding NarL/FixJ family response regulator|nr:DNA-binding response regulator [Blastococcus sp.]
MPVPIAVHDPLPVFRRGAVTTLRDAGFDVDSPDDLGAWAAGSGRKVVLLTLDSPEDWLLLRKLPDGGHHVAVIALLEDADVRTSVQAVLAGADGVLPRECTPEALCDAALRASDGVGLLPISVLRALAHEGPGPARRGDGPLTDGEVNWLRGLSEGLTVRQLAERAGYSERMMYRLLSYLYGNLQVENRTQALMKAHDQGLI